MNVRCGHCKSDFRDVARAVQHVGQHPLKVRPASPGKPLFKVRWNTKTGEIAEVLEAPMLGYV